MKLDSKNDAAKGFVRQKLAARAFLIPSCITVVGIFCGFLAIISAFQGSFEYAAKCIAVAILLDGLDGRVARRLNATSEFGREFDSLSDVVTFGVAPSVLVYSWAFKHTMDEFSILACFVFLVCGATRLARFNISSEKTIGFEGLPTPGAAAAVAALAYLHPSPVTDPAVNIGLLLYLIFLSIMMVSTLPFLSVKHLKFTDGNVRINLLLLATFVALTWYNSRVVILLGTTLYAFSGLLLFLIRPKTKTPRKNQES